jgi:hypothetical protein
MPKQSFRIAPRSRANWTQYPDRRPTTHIPVTGFCRPGYLQGFAHVGYGFRQAAVDSLCVKRKDQCY